MLVVSEHDILASLGLYLKKGFLDVSLCEELIAQMESTPSEAGYLKTSDRGDIADSNLRSARLSGISIDYAYLIRDRLEELKPDLEDYFDLKLKSQEKPQFLLYEPGGHYAPHRDVPSEQSEKRVSIQSRVLSIVVFLNDRSGERSYSGGELTFYELVSDPQWKDYGLPVEAETGLLVAFRSDTLHEVRPVTEGKRFTIANWFHADS